MAKKHKNKSPIYIPNQTKVSFLNTPYPDWETENKLDKEQRKLRKKTK